MDVGNINEGIRDIRVALEIKPAFRAVDDITEIQEELNHIKAFAHLSLSVKRELSSCIDYQIAQPNEVC